MDDSGELRFISAIQALLKIGIPAGVLNPGPQVPSAPGHLVNGVLRRSFFPRQQRALQRATEFLIGVDGKNPVVAGALRCKILLLRIVGPRPSKERGPE